MRSDGADTRYSRTGSSLRARRRTHQAQSKPLEHPADLGLKWTRAIESQYVDRVPTAGRRTPNAAQLPGDPPHPVLLPQGWGPGAEAGPRHPALSGVPRAPHSPEHRKPRGREQGPEPAGRSGSGSGGGWERKRQESSGRGDRWEPAGAGGEGSSEITAVNGRERPRGVGAPPAALGPPHRPCFPGGPAGLRRGLGRPEPAPRHPLALPRGAYLGHGCLPLGPALGHRLIPQGGGHGSPGGIAASRRPPPRAPGLRERARSAGPRTGLGG